MKHHNHAILDRAVRSLNRLLFYFNVTLLIVANDI